MLTSKTAVKPRRIPRQDRSRETVEAVLEAAAQVFERDGYAAGTTNRIAERAGVSIGSLYEYFPNKDAIIHELVRRHILEAEEIAWPTLEQLVRTAPPLREGLTLIVYGMIALHRQAPQLHRVLFEEAPRTNELRAMQRAFFERASGLIGDYLRARPETNIGDTALAGRMVAQVVDQVTHGVVIHPVEGENPDEYAQETITMIERYIAR